MSEGQEIKGKEEGSEWEKKYTHRHIEQQIQDREEKERQKKDKEQ